MNEISEAQLNSMQKAAKIGFVQSLNLRGYNDQQIKNAAAAYPTLLEKRATDRFTKVCALVKDAICG